MRFVHELEPQPSALKAARVALASWCAAEEVDPDSIVIIANELSTNAIRYGQGPVLLHGSCSSQSVGISVQQRGRAAFAIPTNASAAQLQITGRGMQIVDSLAESWGWQTSAERSLIWARVAHMRA